MKSIIRATTILGGSSLVNIAVGLVSAKVTAVLLGPEGVGELGLLQGLLGLATIGAAMGIGTAIVREGAQALAREDERSFAILCRAARWLIGVLSACAVAILLLLREPVATWMLGGSSHAGSVAAIALALVFVLVAGIQTSILNARHRVATLARCSVISSVCGAIVGLSLIAMLGDRGIVWAIVAMSVIGWIVAQYYTWRERRVAAIDSSREETLAASRTLVRFGAPYAASMIVGTGVQFALPALVLHALGSEAVGFYRAATTISVSYLSVLTTAMAQDYYPRVSAVSVESDTLVEIVNQQHKLVMFIAVPVIFGVLALAPYIVALTYSAEFGPAVDILQWQLIGDLFRFSSWTMAFVILARSGSIAFFATELFGGVCSLAVNWIGMRWFGLSGLGIGFLVTYCLYYVVVWAILRRSVRLVWSTQNQLLMLGAILAAALIQTGPLVGFPNLRLPLALSFAALWAGVGAYVLWSEARRPERDGEPG